jgi:hypothetical protein
MSVRMDMKQAGAEVKGTYAFRKGQIRGKVDDSKHSGTWQNDYPALGAFEWTMSPDKRSFTGSYMVGINKLSWSGRRP